MNKAYFAGGCFWCICDYYFSLKIPGIKDIIVGYSGGTENNVNYEMVKSQLTGHRETIEITYDPEIVSLEYLLKIYFSYVDVHDPNGQFIDKGHSYTLALYYIDEKQRILYEKCINGIEKPVFISLEKFNFFIPAEEYHQYFGLKNSEKLIEELKLSNRVCHLKLKNK